MESLPHKNTITFSALQERLIAHVNTRIQNGDFTERGLAKILCISQPQMHNVLKGARKLQIDLADRLLAKLEISISDLLGPEVVPVSARPEPATDARGFQYPPAVRKPPARSSSRHLKYREQAS